MARQANRWAGRLVAATLVLTCALGMLPVTRDASGQVVATPTAAIAVAAQVPPTVFPITTTTHAAVGASLTPASVPITTPPLTDSIGTTATASAQATAPIPTGTTGAPLTTTTALLPSSTPTAAGTVVGTATAAGTAVGTATSVASTSPTFSVTATLTTVTATPLGAQPPVGTSDVSSRNGGLSGSTGLMRPRAVTSNLPTSFASITAGGSHTCALTAAGAAWCWGWNIYGQLGNGTSGNGNWGDSSADSSTPIAVTGGKVFTTIAAGGSHTCGIVGDGAVWCWGSNSSGQLGTGPTSYSGEPAPVSVTGGRNFVAIAAGYGHTCALDGGGQAWCWGTNTNGQIGDGTTQQRTTAVGVTGGRKFSSIVAGNSHTCAIEAGTSKAWCWGTNVNGQLGDGSTGIDRTAPVLVTGDLAFTRVAAGDWHTCGLVSAGAAWCWGYNGSGQLGEGSTGQHANPVAVSGGHSFTAIVAGHAHTCSLAPTGAAWCWGDGGQGQIGNSTSPVSGSIGSQNTNPVPVSGGRSFAALAAGSGHTCGLVSGGATLCWGRNWNGQLGDGAVGGPKPTPAAVNGARAFQSLSAGGSHSCAVGTTGTAWCWGANWYGQLGNGTTGIQAVPVAVSSGSPFVNVAAGGAHTCGLAAGGGAWCWGSGLTGQLGEGGTKVDRSVPIPVSGGISFAALAAGGSHTCGLEKDGSAHCWGRNDHGQLGNGERGDGRWANTAPDRASPVLVLGGHTFTDLVSGYFHTCGLVADGQAWCWGQNSGQVGDGTAGGDQSAPVAVAGGYRFALLAAGYSHTCGVTIGGQSLCWGSNGSGQLGTGTTSSAYTPQIVTGNHIFTTIAAGGDHACGLDSVGTAWCWGNSSDWKTDGSAWGYSNPTPVAVGGGRVFTSIVVGQSHACGLLADRTAWCWGSSSEGQVGDSTANYRSVPGLVVGQFESGSSPIITPELSPAIRSIRIANVRDTSFTVSWVTDVATTGAIRWGPDDGTTPATVVADTRGATATFTVHYVTVNGAKASTRYRFDVVSDVTSDTNAGAHYLVTTGPTLALTGSDQTRGTIARADSTAPDGVVVHVRATGTTGNSAPLAFLITAANAKEWAANLGNLRTATLDATYPVTDTTQIIVTADGGADGTVGATTTVATARTGSLSLALGTPTSMPLQSGWTLVALRVTPSPALTASGVCSLTNLDAPGSVVEVVRWSAGAWESHRCGLPPNDFTLEPGAGYFVRTTVAATWPTWGAAVTTPVTRALITGWNLVGAAVTSPTPSTAPAICTTLNGAVAGSALEVVQWIDAGWAAHTCGTSVNQFTMQAGQGYFVKMAKTGSIALSGASPMASASLRR